VRLEVAWQDSRAGVEHRGMGEDMALEGATVMVPSGAMGGQW
jgi:hypothetical protein